MKTFYKFVYKFLLSHNALENYLETIRAHLNARFGYSCIRSYRIMHIKNDFSLEEKYIVAYKKYELKHGSPGVVNMKSLYDYLLKHSDHKDDKVYTEIATLKFTTSNFGDLNITHNDFYFVADNLINTI